MTSEAFFKDEHARSLYALNPEDFIFTDSRRAFTEIKDIIQLFQCMAWFRPFLGRFLTAANLPLFVLHSSKGEDGDPRFPALGLGRDNLEETFNRTNKWFLPMSLVSIHASLGMFFDVTFNGLKKKPGENTYDAVSRVIPERDKTNCATDLEPVRFALTSLSKSNNKRNSFAHRTRDGREKEPFEVRDQDLFEAWVCGAYLIRRFDSDFLVDAPPAANPEKIRAPKVSTCQHQKKSSIS